MNIVEGFKKQGIDCFNYLIHLDNLKSILIYDTIRPRNFLESRNIKFHEISIEDYQLRRNDNFHIFFPNQDIHDYVPLYVSSYTPLIKKHVNKAKLYYAVLKISTTILNKLKPKKIYKIFKPKYKSKKSNKSTNKKHHRIQY